MPLSKKGKAFQKPAVHSNWKQARKEDINSEISKRRNADNNMNTNDTNAELWRSFDTIKNTTVRDKRKGGTKAKYSKNTLGHWRKSINCVNSGATTGGHASRGDINRKAVACPCHRFEPGKMKKPHDFFKN